MEPKLIAFEGIDGCGKTSVIDAIEEILKNCGFNVYRSYAPGTYFGKLAKFGHPDLPSSQESLYLWWLGRRCEQEKFLKIPKLDIVLADRYYDTTHVYLNLDGTKELHNFDENYFIKPYLTVYLKVDPVVSIQRMETGRPEDMFETNKIDVLQKRCELYEKLIDKHTGWRRFSVIDTNVITLNEVIGLASNHILRHLDHHIEFGAKDE